MVSTAADPASLRPTTTAVPPEGTAAGSVAVTVTAVEPLFSANDDTSLPAAVNASVTPPSTTLIVAVSDTDPPATVADPVIFTVSADSVSPSSWAVS